MQETISFRLYGNLGDTIYCLAGIRQISIVTGKKAILYCALDMRASYYEGAQHETVDGDGNMVMINQEKFDMLRPLLLSQPWVADYRVWKGEKVGVDLTALTPSSTNMPFGNIAHWCRYVFPDMACDLSKWWLWVDPEYNDKVILNFTSRYRNHPITYWFLKEYDQSKMVFAGTKKEHDDFNKRWELNIEYLPVSDFKELAEKIKGCRFVLGNQSFVFSLAESSKVPRILEVCPYAPNVIPSGIDAYDFLHQGGLEYYFKTLYNKSYG